MSDVLEERLDEPEGSLSDRLNDALIKVDSIQKELKLGAYNQAYKLYIRFAPEWYKDYRRKKKRHEWIARMENKEYKSWLDGYGER